MVMRDWKALGLAAEPNTGDNAVHASASPFEAFAECCNWLGASIAELPFGKALLDAGITEDVIKSWTVDPQVREHACARTHARTHARHRSLTTAALCQPPHMCMCTQRMLVLYDKAEEARLSRAEREREDVVAQLLLRAAGCV